MPRGRNWRLLEILPDGTRRYLGPVYPNRVEAAKAREMLPAKAQVYVVRELDRGLFSRRS